MKQDWYQVIGWVMVAIVGLCGVGAALHLVLTLPLGDKGPDWIVAIGTMGTLVMTIYLATAQQRKNDREAYVVAVLAATRYIPELADLISDIRRAITRLDKQHEIDQGEGLFTLTLNALDPAKVWATRDLGTLAPLPSQCALNLAHGLGNVEVARVLLVAVLQSPRVHRDHYFRHEKAESIADKLRAAERFLTKAGKQMSESASGELVDDPVETDEHM